jgi:hypothetical protein
MDHRIDKFVSASDLARLGYCERQVAFDAAHGRRSTKAQRHAQERGPPAHTAFYREGQRIAAASGKKGRCFVATLALGECEETRALRVLRDLYLRRSRVGRWLVGSYYKISPGLCIWLETKPKLLGAVRPLLKALGRVAMAVAKGKLEVGHGRRRRNCRGDRVDRVGGALAQAALAHRR